MSGAKKAGVVRRQFELDLKGEGDGREWPRDAWSKAYRNSPARAARPPRRQRRAVQAPGCPTTGRPPAASAARSPPSGTCAPATSPRPPRVSLLPAVVRGRDHPKALAHFLHDLPAGQRRRRLVELLHDLFRTVSRSFHGSQGAAPPPATSTNTGRTAGWAALARRPSPRTTVHPRPRSGSTLPPPGMESPQ